MRERAKNNPAKIKASKLSGNSQSSNSSVNTSKTAEQEIPSAQSIINERWEFEKEFRKSILSSEEVTSLLTLANARWARIEGMGNYSRAIERALDESGREGFEILDSMDSKEILAEIQRAKVFINDFTSTIKGSNWWTQEMYISATLPLFSLNQTKSLDGDFLKNAFRLYRTIEDDLGAELIREYGSDRLINYLYSSIVESGNKDLDESDRVELYNLGLQKIDEMLEFKYGQFSEAFARENEVSWIADYTKEVAKEFEKEIDVKRESIWDYL